MGMFSDKKLFEFLKNILMHFLQKILDFSRKLIFFKLDTRYWCL